MKEYTIVPEFRYFKAFPIVAIIYQLVAVGFVILGCFITSSGFILALLFQISSIYYLVLCLCNRNYRLNFTSDGIIVWNIFKKSKKHKTDNLRWKIRRIPWYNKYYIFLYSSGRIPIAFMKPLWKNALKTLYFPHFGALSSEELKYLKFLKSAGILGQDIRGHFYVLR